MILTITSQGDIVINGKRQEIEQLLLFLQKLSLSTEFPFLTLKEDPR